MNGAEQSVEPRDGSARFRVVAAIGLPVDIYGTQGILANTTSFYPEHRLTHVIGLAVTGIDTKCVQRVVHYSTLR